MSIIRYLLASEGNLSFPVVRDQRASTPHQMSTSARAAKTLFFIYFCIHSFNSLNPHYVPGAAESWRDSKGKTDEKPYFHREVWQNQTRTGKKEENPAVSH